MSFVSWRFRYEEKPARRTGRASSTVIRKLCGVSLHRQLLAATATTSSQHATTVLRCHAGAEAVNLTPLTLLGLVRTEHGQHSSSISSLRGQLPRIASKAAFRLYQHLKPLSSKKFPLLRLSAPLPGGVRFSPPGARNPVPVFLRFSEGNAIPLKNNN